MTRLWTSFLKRLVRFVLTLVYRPRVIDADKIPAAGGVLMMANHVSFLDPVLIYCFQKRRVRFIADQAFVPKGYGTWAARLTDSILFEPGNRRSVVEMIRKAREALKNGDVVCIFPEGGITRTGQLKAFETGLLSFLKQGNEDVPVLPIYLGGLLGSRFGYSRTIYNRRTGGRLFQRVTVAFGDPIHRPRDVYQLHRTVAELGVDAMNPTRFPNDRHFMIPVRQMLRNLRGKNGNPKGVDSTGVRLTSKQILLRSLVARRVFRRIIGPNDKTVGLLLPTSVGGMIANAALTLDRRIPINLNYTMANETLDYCSDLTGIRQIVTSKKFLQKFPKMKLKAEWILAEDILKKVPVSDKLLGLFDYLLPTWILERKLGLTKIKPDDLMTIVFTSGSTGKPKGAMLSHINIASNIHQFYELYAPNYDERIMGALPFFHSFGFTTTIWCPLICPFGVVYHFSPLDAKVIGEMARKEKVTIFPSTATFFRNYLRRCPKEDFAQVITAVAGAEKLPADLAESWKEKYGQELVEGFGATELSPVLAASLPHCRYPDDFHPYQKSGSIGIPLGETVVRITDPETGEELPANTPGMMEVKGPTVMLGYYNEPKRTADAVKDGWYLTGDIAKIDDDGFIFITGRQSRISKIGGEMVPHVFVEEEIEKILKKYDAPSGAVEEGEGDGSELRIAVTAVPDAKKGEKIVVLHTAIPVSAEMICRELADSGLPQLWIPATQDFRPVDSIPMLGTGKPSLKVIRDTALALYGFDRK